MEGGLDNNFLKSPSDMLTFVWVCKNMLAVSMILLGNHVNDD